MQNYGTKLLKFLNIVAHFLVENIKNTHKEGYVFILIGILVTILMYSIASFLGNICAIITIWIVYFFRDPHRITPQKNGIMVSPADGVITSILKDVNAPSELDIDEEQKFTKISIFLNVFNVHVNRIPVKSEIKKICYVPGKFFNATLDKSSTDNERNIILLKTEGGEDVVLTQIAGLIARRIVCYAQEAQSFNTGERYGIIRFGSRVDVFIPSTYSINVELGQTMTGGETVIANK